MSPKSLCFIAIFAILALSSHVVASEVVDISTSLEGYVSSRFSFDSFK